MEEEQPCYDRDVAASLWAQAVEQVQRMREQDKSEKTMVALTDNPHASKGATDGHDRSGKEEIPESPSAAAETVKVNDVYTVFDN
jgi:hypothetical protein